MGFLIWRNHTLNYYFLIFHFICFHCSFSPPAIVWCCFDDICCNTGIASSFHSISSEAQVLLIYTSYPVSWVLTLLTSGPCLPIQDVWAAAVDTPGRHGAPGADGVGGRRRESGETRLRYMKTKPALVCKYCCKRKETQTKGCPSLWRACNIFCKATQKLKAQ